MANARVNCTGTCVKFRYVRTLQSGKDLLACVRCESVKLV